VGRVSALKCHACGNELPLKARFCPSCGVKIELEDIPAETVHHEKQKEIITCRNCGSGNDAELTYCESCGARLSGALQNENDVITHQRKRSQEKIRRGKKRGKIEIWHSAIILAVFAVIIIVLYLIVKNERETSVTQEPLAVAAPLEAKISAKIDSLESVVRANPEDPAARLKLANALHDAQKFIDAIGEYKNYLVLNPCDVDAMVDMGICYFELRDYSSARAEMEKGLSIDPKHQLAHFNLGIVSLQERNIEQARLWFEKTIAIDSTNNIAKRSRMMIQQHSFPVKK